MKEILWTIQNEAAFEQFIKTGVLRADPDHIAFDGDFRKEYDWMVAQMRERIGAPPVGVEYPVWAWYQWEGKRGRRDLRHSGYAKRGTPMVQIGFEIDAKDFLLSDFADWHFVLNNSYLADNEQEWDDFYANGGEDKQDEIRTSWLKIFDLQRYAPRWTGDPSRQSIQATLWEVKRSQIIKIEHFLAK